MTHFHNFGLINNMSKHMANNSTPNILNYDYSDRTGYTYNQGENTSINRNSVPESVDKQQRFDNMVNEILYQSRTNKVDDSARASQIISSLQNNTGYVSSYNVPVNNESNRNNEQFLRTSADIKTIDDNEQRYNSYNRNIGNIDTSFVNSRHSMVVICVVIFVVFMMLQIYITQKKIEMMLSLSMHRKNLVFNDINE